MLPVLAHNFTITIYAQVGYLRAGAGPGGLDDPALLSRLRDHVANRCLIFFEEMQLAAIVVIGLPFLAAAALLLVQHSSRQFERLALLPPLLALATGTLMWRAAGPDSVVTIPIPMIPSLGFDANLRIDRLGSFFVILIGTIGAAVVQFSRFYFTDRVPHLYWPLLLTFMGCMLGLVLSDSLILFYVFWEGTTVTSALLIGIDSTSKTARVGGIQAFIVTGAGGLALLTGTLLLVHIGGSSNISDLAANSAQIMLHPSHQLALLLMALGAFAKSAQWPLHFWLPGAMSAPAPISAFLHSATMVNAGVFLLGRLVPVLGNSPLWHPLLSTVGILTFLIGSWLSFRSLDLKKLLAYGTVSYLGLLTTMYAYAPVTGSKGELLHFANHAIYKSSLFLLLGWFERIAGTRDIKTLDQQYWLPRQPFGAVLFIVGALAMAGGPFVLSFESKKIFFEYVVGSAVLPVVELAIFVGSTLTVATALKLSVTTFWGKKLPAHPQRSVSPWLVAIPAVLLAPQFIGGLAPGWVLGSVLEPSWRWPSGVSVWAKFDRPTMVKMLIFGCGIALFCVWRPISRLPKMPSMELFAGHATEMLLAAATQFRSLTQAGGFARYLLVLFALGTAVAVYHAVHLPSLWPARPMIANVDDLMGTLPCVVTACGALLTVLHRQRVAKLIGLALSGYGLTVLYVVYRAPDLALTQVLVETVSLILVLLAFRHLPELSREQRTSWQHLLHGCTAALLGLVMFLVTAMASQSSRVGRTGDLHLEKSLSEAGGRNAVNVVLTDFRAMDTLIEIGVLVVAALGVLSVLRLRRRA